MQTIYEIISELFKAACTAAHEGKLAQALARHDEADKAIQHEMRTLQAWEKIHESMRHEKELAATRKLIDALQGVERELAVLRSLIDTTALLQSVQTVRYTGVVGQA